MALRPSYRNPASAGEDIPASGIGAVVFMVFVAAGSAYIIAAKLGTVTLPTVCTIKREAITRGEIKPKERLQP